MLCRLGKSEDGKSGLPTLREQKRFPQKRSRDTGSANRLRAADKDGRARGAGEPCPARRVGLACAGAVGQPESASRGKVDRIEVAGGGVPGRAEQR